jgi:hypothetical protein
MQAGPIWLRRRGICDLAALRGGSMISSIILSGGELLGAGDYRRHVTFVLTLAGS